MGKDWAWIDGDLELDYKCLARGAMEGPQAGKAGQGKEAEVAMAQ